MTVVGSAFDYKNVEFTSEAIYNRLKRHQNLTPIMKWEFRRDMIRMMTKIRTMKADIDNQPPKKPSLIKAARHREEVEEGRLRIIRKENRELLERLRKIHNRPKSSFCRLKSKGDYLVKGDAFRLPPPRGGKALYLVQMYKELKLANPLSARKSIRVQQEMLSSAVRLVARATAASPSQPTPEMVDTLVQAALAAPDPIVLPVPVVEQTLSPVQLVQLAKPLADVVVTDPLAPGPPPSPSSDVMDAESCRGQDGETVSTEGVVASTDGAEISVDGGASPAETSPNASSPSQVDGNNGVNGPLKVDASDAGNGTRIEQKPEA